jgi:hypothetical protein
MNDATQGRLPVFLARQQGLSPLTTVLDHRDDGSWDQLILGTRL